MPGNDTQKAPPKKGALGSIVKVVIFLAIGLFFIYWFLLKLDNSQKEDI